MLYNDAEDRETWLGMLENKVANFERQIENEAKRCGTFREIHVSNRFLYSHITTASKKKSAACSCGKAALQDSSRET